MTTNKTTALIERIRETVAYFDDEFSKEVQTDVNKLYANLDVWKQPLCQYAGGVTANDLLDVLEALAAFEQPNECRAENGVVAHGEMPKHPRKMVGYPPLDADAFENAFNAWRYDTDESPIDRDAALCNAIQYYIDEAGLVKKPAINDNELAREMASAVAKATTDKIVRVSDMLVALTALRKLGVLTNVKCEQPAVRDGGKHEKA